MFVHWGLRGIRIRVRIRSVTVGWFAWDFYFYIKIIQIIPVIQRRQNGIRIRVRIYRIDMICHKIIEEKRILIQIPTTLSDEIRVVGWRV